MDTLLEKMEQKERGMDGQIDIYKRDRQENRQRRESDRREKVESEKSEELPKIPLPSILFAQRATYFALNFVCVFFLSALFYIQLR